MQLLRLLCLACLTWFLASCGGGGSSPTPVSTTCSLGLTTYADTNSSGVNILQNAPTNAVARPLTGCDISALQSAQVRVCLEHSRVDELAIQIVEPLTSPQWGNLVADTTASAAERNFCAFNNASIYTLMLPNAVLSGIQSLNTSWNVAVIDRNNNTNTGTFVSWSVVLSGLK